MRPNLSLIIDLPCHPVKFAAFWPSVDNMSREEEEKVPSIGRPFAASKTIPRSTTVITLSPSLLPVDVLNSTVGDLFQSMPPMTPLSSRATAWNWYVILGVTVMSMLSSEVFTRVVIKSGSECDCSHFLQCARFK